MDIKYSIVRGSLVKPTGLTMYSPGYTKDLDSDNRQMQQVDQISMITNRANLLEGRKNRSNMVWQ